MAEDDLEERIERAEESWQEVSSGAPPEDCEWGFFSYGDAPPAIGGGVGMFTWFPDRASMLDFIKHTLPYNIAEKAAAVVEKLKLGSINDLDGIKELNEVLVTCSQLDWMGTVDGLLSGDHPYAVHVRQAFRDDEKEDSEGEPIAEDEKEEFFDFLESWGI